MISLASLDFLTISTALMIILSLAQTVIPLSYYEILETYKFSYAKSELARDKIIIKAINRHENHSNT